MALLIDIQQTEASDASALFEYWVDQKQPGVISYDKTTGEFALVKESEGEKGMALFARALGKLQKTLRDTGKLPEKLVYAA